MSAQKIGEGEGTGRERERGSVSRLIAVVTVEAERRARPVFDRGEVLKRRSFYKLPIPAFIPRAASVDLSVVTLTG